MLYYQLTEVDVRQAKTFLGVPMAFWKRILLELKASPEVQAYVRLLPHTNYLKARSSLMAANGHGPERLCHIVTQRDQRNNAFILTKRGTVLP